MRKGDREGTTRKEQDKAKKINIDKKIEKQISYLLFKHSSACVLHCTIITVKIEQKHSC